MGPVVTTMLNILNMGGGGALGFIVCPFLSNVRVLVL